MKHLFIVNPVAGGKDKTAVVFEAVKAALEGKNEEFEIYVTKGPKDATREIKAAAERANGEMVRVYSCGGDGILNECVNGAAGLSNVAVTVYAMGTGNDFIKSFGDERELFFDMKKLVNGTIHPIDYIDCNGTACIDICSIGVDARIGTSAHKYSKLPLLGGTSSYITSLVVNVIKGIQQHMHITAPGYDEEGSFTMFCICNGNFYGGGFNPVKDARVDDGVLNCLAVKGISRLKAAPLISKYGDGRYAEIPEYITRIDCQHCHVELKEEDVINIDGEALYGTSADINIVPGGVNFIAPEGMKYFD